MSEPLCLLKHRYRNMHQLKLESSDLSIALSVDVNWWRSHNHRALHLLCMWAALKHTVTVTVEGIRENM